MVSLIRNAVVAAAGADRWAGDMVSGNHFRRAGGNDRNVFREGYTVSLVFSIHVSGMVSPPFAGSPCDRSDGRTHCADATFSSVRGYDSAPSILRPEE